MGKTSASNQSGQAVVEYILLLSIVIVILAGFVSKFSTTFDAGSVNLGGRLETQMRTGRAPATLWKK